MVDVLEEIHVVVVVVEFM